MPWQITDDESTDVYPHKWHVIDAIKMAMEDDDYLEVAEGWGWRVREVTATNEKQEDNQ